MAEITYKKKTETRYKLDGDWWTILDIDKFVTFQNVETGGFLYGVILDRVDGNEWRVIEERDSRYLKPVETEVEPPSISVIVKLPSNSVSNPHDFLVSLCEAMDFDGTDQVNYPTWIGERGSKLCEFKIEKGHQSIDVLLNNAAKCFDGLGVTLCGVSSPEGMVVYDLESLRVADVDKLSTD